MTGALTDRPELFWISGSPPAWRVLLGLALKEIPYISCRLDPSKSEHKSEVYLSINPRGRVPTLRFENVVIHESIAILAFLDARWPARPLFGRDPARAAAVWQAVIEVETALHAPLGTVARILFRGQAADSRDELISAAQTTREELARWERALELDDFTVGDQPSAADCMLYPSIAWLRRAIQQSAAGTEIPANVLKLFQDFPQIVFWGRRVQALPGFESTYPPHWREAEKSPTI